MIATGPETLRWLENRRTDRALVHDRTRGDESVNILSTNGATNSFLKDNGYGKGKEYITRSSGIKRDLTSSIPINQRGNHTNTTSQPKSQTASPSLQRTTDTFTYTRAHPRSAMRWQLDPLMISVPATQSTPCQRSYQPLRSETRSTRYGDTSCHVCVWCRFSSSARVNSQAKAKSPRFRSTHEDHPRPTNRTFM